MEKEEYNNKKNRLNALYEKTKNRKLQEIDSVNNNITFKARVGKLIKVHPKLITGILIAITIVLILTFYSNLKMLTLVLLMYVIMIIFLIYCNTFTITCKNNKVSVITNMQEIVIDYKNLKNIFIDKREERIFIKKRNLFMLVILYKAPNGNISNIELPVLFISEKELEKFLENFELKPQKSSKNLEKAKEYKFKRILIKIGLFILIWTLIIVSFLIQR